MVGEVNTVFTNFAILTYINILNIWKTVKVAVLKFDSSIICVSSELIFNWFIILLINGKNIIIYLVSPILIDILLFPVFY